ncbi:MAG: hypothetical protein CL706_00020 [Chloroflexi bacterium]|nr:hypothetical protein [Chloroflexota bacterium]
MSNGSKIYISCPMWKPVDALLKHQRIHSKYNSDLLINYKINDINLIIETINKGLILSYETILMFAIEGNLEGVEKLVEIKLNDGEFMFPMTEKLFNHACMSGNQKLIKFLQEKKCIEDEYALIHIISNNHPKETIIWGLDNLHFGLQWYLNVGKYRSTYPNHDDIIIAAIGTGDLNLLKFLMEKGFNCVLDNKHLTNGDLLPLKCACELPFQYGKSMIEFLIKKKYKYNTSILYWTDKDSEEDIVNRWKLLFELCDFDKKELEEFKIRHNKWIETVVKKKFDNEWLIKIGLL